MEKLSDQQGAKIADLAWCFGWSLYLGGSFNFFKFSPLLKGKIPIFDSYFSTGWFNHQLVTGMAPGVLKELKEKMRDYHSDSEASGWMGFLR